MAVSRSCEIAGLAYKGSCDHSSYRMISAHDFTGLFADFVKLFKRNDLFMSCDLENAVSGCIDDELAGLHVLFAEVADDQLDGVVHVEPRDVQQHIRASPHQVEGGLEASPHLLGAHEGHGGIAGGEVRRVVHVEVVAVVGGVEEEDGAEVGQLGDGAFQVAHLELHLLEAESEGAVSCGHLRTEELDFTVLVAGGGSQDEAGQQALAVGYEGLQEFSVAAGGLVCTSCAQTIPDAEPLAPSQVAWLRSCIGLTFDELLVAPINPDTALFLLGAAHAWAATQLSARLKAFEFALSL